MWSLTAWVQRDAIRVNEEAQMDDIRITTRPLPAGSTARTLRRLEPLPPGSFPRPSSEISTSVDDLDAQALLQSQGWPLQHDGPDGMPEVNDSVEGERLG